MNTYQKWLQSEGEWIDTYCKKIRRQALCITTPLILAGLTILMGVLPMVGGGSTEDLLYGAFGGFLLGVFICGIYLLRFVLTPHYAFLEGSTPYSILVRLSDIAWISRGEEQKTAITHQAKSRTVYNFTLHTIGFYRKDRVQNNSADGELPDAAYGFFDAGIREQVAELLKETGFQVR